MLLFVLLYLFFIPVDKETSLKYKQLNKNLIFDLYYPVNVENGYGNVDISNLIQISNTDSEK